MNLISLNRTIKSATLPSSFSAFVSFDLRNCNFLFCPSFVLKIPGESLFISKFCDIALMVQGVGRRVEGYIGVTYLKGVSVSSDIV